MDQPTRLPLRRPGITSLPAGIVATAAVGSAAAHVVTAATGPEGVMAWWMAAMGVACLACAAPLLPGRFCAGKSGGVALRASGHLMAMSAVMILVHLVLLVAPGAGTHHRGMESPPAHSHDVTMLALISVELICLMAASAALRIARRSPHRRRALTT